MFQHLRHARALQSHDTLITLAAGLGIDSDNEFAITQERGQIARREIVAPLGGGAQMKVAAAFHHCQCHRPAALHLHNQRAIEFQRRGKQGGSGHHLAQ